MHIQYIYASLQIQCITIIPHKLAYDTRAKQAGWSPREVSVLCGEAALCKAEEKACWWLVIPAVDETTGVESAWVVGATLLVQLTAQAATSDGHAEIQGLNVR